VNLLLDHYIRDGHKHTLVLKCALVGPCLLGRACSCEMVVCLPRVAAIV